MGISDTSFFNSYHHQLGLVYSNGVNEQLNLVQTFQNYVRARQSLVQGFSSSELSSGLTIVNAHLANEATYTNATTNIIKSVIQSLNTFYNTNYGRQLRDMFNGVGATRLIAWNSAFKEAFYQATSSELVQHVGFATWNGTDFVMYPPNYSGGTRQNSVTVVTATTNTNVVVSGFASNITDFALIGDYIVYAPSGSLPHPTSISTTNVVTGYANTNTLILGNSVSLGVGTSIYSYRAIKNDETMEFRFGTSAISPTGVCTYLFSNVVLRVSITDNTGSAVTTTNVSISSTTNGRALIGLINNNNYKGTGISSILLTSGSMSAFGTNRVLEVWTKGSY